MEMSLNGKWLQIVISKYGFSEDTKQSAQLNEEYVISNNKEQDKNEKIFHTR